MSNKQKRLVTVALCLAAGAAVWAYYHRPLPGRVPEQYVLAGRPPSIAPDYVDCVVPPNIAPLNFVVQEEGSEFCVRVYGDNGEAFVVAGRRPSIVMPQDKWRRLLAANRGGRISFDVYVRRGRNPWRRYETVSNAVAPEDVDPFVVYRLIGPVHNYGGWMGIYQRDIESFDETPILRNDRFGGVQPCMNCHTFANNDPGKMIIHMRSGLYGHAMLLADDGDVSKRDTRTALARSPAAYTAWHPSGQVAAFSVNSLSLQHQARGEGRDVFDYNSDLVIHVVASNEVLLPEGISAPEYLETFPTWSPDGRYLYFARTAKTWPDALAQIHILPTGYDEVRYDLMRISYDVAAGRWGPVETVLSADQIGRSITEPRISPDGRFLLFTTAGYGNFPIYMDDSDLYMMDLSDQPPIGQPRRHWRLAANSDDWADTWHSWSSNGRWIIFTSKRYNGRLFSRLYLSYIDENGRSHKPVLLPQRDPTFYDSFLKTFNAPEFTTGPVMISERQLVRAITASSQGEDVSAISGASPEGDAPHGSP